MQRRNFIRNLGLGGVALMGATASVAVAQAKNNGNSKVPRGTPFQELLREINALQMQMDDGIFPRLQVIEPSGGANLLIFGPTGECRLGVDPQGPAGLQLVDPSGIRVLTPAGQPSARETTGLRILFGPTDDCSIGIRDGGGMMILDPDGLFIGNPRAGAPSLLSFGVPECRIRAGGLGDDGQTLGMIFEDPNGFMFENDVTVEGQVFAKEVVETSSRALKKDIAPIDDALTKIDRLQGVYFNWKTQESLHPEIGLIAEDVAEVMPEAVAVSPEDGSPQGVKYTKLVAVAIEGIKDQQRQIARLEAEKEALKQEVSMLRTQLSDISAEVDRLAVATGAA